MYKHLIIATILICLLGYFSAAQAASSSFSINIKNTSGSTKDLLKGGDLGGNQAIAHNLNNWTRFSTNDTAWYLKTKKHNHNIEVKAGNTSYCRLTIWLKNKVEFFGNTKIKDYGYNSSNNQKCVLKRDPTSGPDLSMELIIK